MGRNLVTRAVQQTTVRGGNKGSGISPPNHAHNSHHVLQIYIGFLSPFQAMADSGNVNTHNRYLG